jgi:hypothetical protein
MCWIPKKMTLHKVIICISWFWSSKTTNCSHDLNHCSILTVKIFHLLFWFYKHSGKVLISFFITKMCYWIDHSGCTPLRQAAIHQHLPKHFPWHWFFWGKFLHIVVKLLIVNNIVELNPTSNLISLQTVFWIYILDREWWGYLMDIWYTWVQCRPHSARQKVPWVVCSNAKIQILLNSIE